MKIFNYNVHRKNFLEQRHDGVAIAVRRDIPHKLLDDFVENILAIEVETTRGPIVIATTYLPPRRNYLPFPDLYRLINRPEPVYLIGDLNARHTALGHHNINTVGRQLNTMLTNNELCHLGPDFPTRINNTTASTIDIVLATPNASLNIHLKPGPLTSSDHTPVVLTLSTSPIQVPTREREVLRRADWTRFQTILQATIAPDLQTATKEEIDHELDTWYKDIDLARKECIPRTRHKTIQYPRRTPELTNLENQHRRIRDEANRTGWTRGIRQMHRAIQISIRDEWKEEYDKTWNELMQKTQDNYKNPKQFWKDVKRLMGTAQPEATYLLDHQNRKIFKAEEKERLMRRHLEKCFRISDEENEDFDQTKEEDVEEALLEHMDLITPLRNANPENLLYENPLMRKINPRETKETIKQFKNHKAPGESGISKEILANLPNKMILRLTNIMNACLSMGYFPDAFKVAKIIFIPKPNKNPHRIENKRPISLLETPGKTFESIINNRLRNYLEDNNMYNPDQQGFRRNRGTTTAIAKIYEEIAVSQSQENQCNVILRDVSKAFDKVWHQGLKFKLLSLGLPSNMTRLLCSFLDDRKSRIQMENYLGPPFNLLSGVPQGSCLSPTLYTLFTRDIPDPVPGTTHTIYADDITQIIVQPGKEREPMTRRMEAAIININQYEKQWKIKTNMDKFQIIPISKRIPADIIVEGTRLQYSQTGKVLGLTLKRNGSSAHAKERVRQAGAQLTRLRRFNRLETKTKIHLYKALIRPILEYPPVPLHTISKTQKLNIQKIQNRAILWATNNPRGTALEPLHEALNLEAMNKRTERQAKKCWERLETIEEGRLEELIDPVTTRNHQWWPRSRPLLTREETPLFTSTANRR